MTTLAARVLEAIEAAEALANAASPGPWHANPEHDEVLAVDDITVCEGFALSNNQLRATVDFIVGNDPQVARLRCAVDRIVLDRHEPVEFGGKWWCSHCATSKGGKAAPVEAPCLDLLDLACALGVPLEQEET